ncbi:aquaporin Z [Vibrio olivae]
MNKYLAEAFGTFWLVLGGCGSAVLAAGFPEVGIGLLGVALAFGLTVLTMAFAIGHISGCHLNPAVTIGLWAGGRFDGREILPYVIAQVIGGIIAGGILYLIASGQVGFDVAGSGFAANGYGMHSPRSVLFLCRCHHRNRHDNDVFDRHHGRNRRTSTSRLAPIAIGLCLTLIHLISIPVSNTSVNPARSTAVAIYVGDWATSQLWIFWLAPIIGGIVGAVMYRVIAGSPNPRHAVI